MAHLVDHYPYYALNPVMHGQRVSWNRRPASKQVMGGRLANITHAGVANTISYRERPVKRFQNMH